MSGRSSLNSGTARLPVVISFRLAEPLRRNAETLLQQHVDLHLVLPSPHYSGYTCTQSILQPAGVPIADFSFDVPAVRPITCRKVLFDGYEGH